MTGYEYKFGLLLLYAALIVGAFLVRKFQSEGWREYALFIGPAAVIFVAHLLGGLEWGPLGKPLPDLGDTWNPIVYTGFLVGLTLFTCFKIRDHKEPPESLIDPK